MDFKNALNWLFIFEFLLKIKSELKIKKNEVSHCVIVLDSYKFNDERFKATKKHFRLSDRSVITMNVQFWKYTNKKRKKIDCRIKKSDKMRNKKNWKRERPELPGTERGTAWRSVGERQLYSPLAQRFTINRLFTLWIARSLPHIYFIKS